MKWNIHSSRTLLVTSENPSGVIVLPDKQKDASGWVLSNYSAKLEIGDLVDCGLEPSCKVTFYNLLNPSQGRFLRWWKLQGDIWEVALNSYFLVTQPTGWHISWWTWVGLTLILILDVQHSAWFCLGWWEIGRTGWAGGQDGETSKIKVYPTQVRQEMCHPVGCVTRK